jgi:hypothetical protein
VLTTIEDRAQAFLSESTQHLEAIDPDRGARVSLDWDAQKWKVPRDAMDDEAFRALVKGAGLSVVSTMIAKAAAPKIERAAAGFFFMASGRIVGSMWPQVVGAVAGTAIEPGIGSLAGWTLGITSGLAIDYLSNRYREHLDRPAVEKGHFRSSGRNYARVVSRHPTRFVSNHRCVVR